MSKKKKLKQYFINAKILSSSVLAGIILRLVTGNAYYADMTILIFGIWIIGAIAVLFLGAEPSENK